MQQADKEKNILFHLLFCLKTLTLHKLGCGSGNEKERAQFFPLTLR